ncbi:hypothetical protein IMZ48_06055 [Candidatus Bathyarchaeota archaeon]|nr:hypothetical protein [Candidatus Bathyarchaeota archaeon]
MTALSAEKTVLSCIPYLRDAAENLAPGAGADDKAAGFDPFGTRVWKTRMVQLSGKNRAMNEYSIERVGEDVKETLVMLHGYGAGLGFFYKNYEPLTRVPGWKLYSLDMLGMGNSVRFHFRPWDADDLRFKCRH